MSDVRDRARTALAHGSTLMWLFALAFVATLAYGRHGYSGEDEGFLIGLAWRVIHGDLPYRDFLYIRPPVSVYLHAIPLLVLPASLHFIGERFLFYLTVAGYSHIAMSLLRRSLPALRSIPLPWLTVAAFALSVQNFPPMPWHTTDGILFCVLAVLFVTRGEGVAGCVWAAGCLVLASGCKQSFLPMHLVVAGALFIAGRRREFAAFALATAAFGLGVLGLLGAAGIAGEFASQVTGQTRIGAVLYAGGIRYVQGAASTVLLIAAVVVPVLAVGRAWSGRWGIAWIPYLGLTTILGVSVFRLFERATFQTPLFNYPALLWILGAGVAAGALHEDRRGAQPLGLLLAVGWCASLSWGYQTPVLLGAPLIVAAIEVARRAAGTNPRRLALAFLVFAVGYQAVAYRFPYREEPRSQLSASLGDAFERFRPVRSTPERLERYRELGDLHRRYGDRMTVLPSMPLANYLTDTVPVFPIDWALDVEADGRTAWLVEALEREAPVVFVERGAAALCTGRPRCSEVSMYVLNNWTLVERAKYLDVYRKPTGKHSSSGDRGPG